MGQKVNPIGFRTGITEGWRSRWYAPKAAYGDFLVEDARIRKFIDERLNRRPPYAAVAKVEIERTRNEVKVFIHTARPGVVIGPRGSEIDRLKDALESMFDRQIALNVVEIKNPDLNAQLVAEGIAEQLLKRASFRRVMKMRCESAMGAGALGVKVLCAGRLGGSEMARKELQSRGSVPLVTLQAHVDYGMATSKTTYGTIGVKVWINLGHYGDEIVAKEYSARPQGRRGKR